MKLLLFSDLHLDTQFAWGSRSVSNNHRSAIRQALNRIAELAISTGADALCCGGDLYEQERFTADTAQFLRSTFEGLRPLPVIVAPGNHDWYGPASLYRQVDWSDNVHIFSQPRFSPLCLSPTFTLWGAAHCAPANTPNFLEDFHVQGEGVHVALFHGSEQGRLHFERNGKQPHAPFYSTQIREAGLHHALLGHFHTPRDEEYFTYPGNPEPLSFGERGVRSAVLLDFNSDGFVRRDRHVVSDTAISDIEVSLDGIFHQDQARNRVAQALATACGTVRLTLSGAVSSDVNIDFTGLESLAPHLEALVVRPPKLTVAYDYETLSQEKTVRGQFVRDVMRATELSSDQRRRVLITGLRALEGRSDELEIH